MGRGEAVVITGGVTMDSVRFLLAVLRWLSVTVTVKLAVAVAAGVPAIVPAEDKNSGAGSDPAVMVHGP